MEVGHGCSGLLQPPGPGTGVGVEVGWFGTVMEPDVYLNQVSQPHSPSQLVGLSSAAAAGGVSPSYGAVGVENENRFCDAADVDENPTSGAVDAEGGCPFFGAADAVGGCPFCDVAGVAGESPSCGAADGAPAYFGWCVTTLIEAGVGADVTDQWVNP